MARATAAEAATEAKLEAARATRAAADEQTRAATTRRDARKR